MLKAGVGAVDISPKLGVQLAGYPHCPRENTGVHDPIFASAIHLDDGANKVTMVCLDLLSFGKELCAKIRSQFPYPITFTCTHTHCAPWMSDPLASEKEEGICMNEAYAEETVAKIVELLKKVEKETFSAELATAVGHCGAEHGVGGNRREKGGLCDPAVNILAVREKGGAIRGILVNYALHPTYLHAENTLVTADYPCYIRRYFHFAEPEAVVMFAQGCSGNQSSRYHRVGQDFEEAARVGSTIGVKVADALETATFKDDIKVSLTSTTIEDLPMKTYPPVEVTQKLKEEAEAYYASVKDKDYITARNAELAMFGAQNNYVYSKLAGEKSPELPMEVVTLVVDDTLIVQLQGELFVEFGLKIKSYSRYAKTFVFEVSNGYLPGYIYTEEAGKEGGYEVGTSQFDISIETFMTNKLKEIVENV